MEAARSAAGGMTAVEAALDRAAVACARRGAQLTELRRQVLRLVLESEAPIGAYALLNRLKAARPGAAPPTVYRALEFLLEQGLIHRVERLNAFIGCVEAGTAASASQMQGGHEHDHPHQFLICRRCGVATELTDAAVARALAGAAERAGFTVTLATVEIEGTCARCWEAAGGSR
jgi:Fur family transcriptional regulator, zinc uptake regulator